MNCTSLLEISDMKLLVLLCFVAFAAAQDDKKQNKRSLDYGFSSFGYDGFHGSDLPVAVPVHVPVDRPYPVPVPKPYPVHIAKPYPVPVDRPYPVRVPVYHKIPVPVPKPYPVVVHKPYPVVVHKPIYLESHGWSGFNRKWSGW